MHKTAAVFDTNILISSVFWSGNPFELIQKAINQEIIVFVSAPILAEIRRVLERDFHVNEQEREDIIDSFMLFLQFCKPVQKTDVIKEDPDDNRILECAVSCKAQYIISGDRHLLKLKQFRGIKILTATEFLELPLKEKQPE